MPFVSDKQRRYLYSQKPEVARKFAQHKQAGGAVMPDMFGQMSLRDMIDSYRNDLKQKRVSIPTETPEAAPAVSYGDPMAHPGEPMGQDVVPAWLTPGEFVVNAEAMQDPMNAAVVEDINTQGQMIQDQNAILQQPGLPTGMNAGGYVQYRNEGGFLDPAVGSATGQRLALIGAGDLTGAAGVTPDFSGQAYGGGSSGVNIDYSTQTWIDPQTGKKYVRKEGPNGVQFIEIGTNAVVTDPEIISRLRQVGTSGSGEATVGETPKNIYAKNDIITMLRALSDAKRAIHAGAGDVIHFINKKSVSGAEIAKVIAAAKAAGGNEEVFRVLNGILGDALIKGRDQDKVDQYFNFLHTVSQFEVIASKTSGESRLTDEDAKRYLRAIVNPDSPPNSILEQLGRVFYSTKYEEARTEAWQVYVNETARKDQRNEYWFNKHVWNAKSQELEATRDSVVEEFATPKFVPDASWTEAITKGGDEDGESITINYGDQSFTFTEIKKSNLSDHVVDALSDGKGEDLTIDGVVYKNVVVWQDDETQIVYAVSGSFGTRKWWIES